MLGMSFTVTHTILATDYSYYNGKSVDTFLRKMKQISLGLDGQTELTVVYRSYLHVIP